MPLSTAGMYSRGISAANDFVLKHIAAARGQGLDREPYVTVLTATTCLFDVFAFLFDLLGDGFFVGDLGLADVCFDFKFTHHTVYDDFKMQFAHSGDDGLVGLRIHS